MKKYAKIFGKVLLFLFFVGMYAVMGVLGYEKGYYEGQGDFSFMFYSLCYKDSKLVWPQRPTEEYRCARLYKL